MRKTVPGKQTKRPDEADTAFAQLAEKLSKDPRVDDPRVARAKGFGSKGLKVARKLFAFLSKARLVVKLPWERVEALASKGSGERFDPGHGRLMKEWIAIDFRARELWLPLAEEALEFAARDLREAAAPRSIRKR
jgi:hypothetical protein